MKKLGIIAVAVLLLGGCKQQPSVVSALNVVQQVIMLAQADLPALQVAGTLSSADMGAITNWLSAASTIVAQGQTCVAGLGAGGATSALANCVNTIGTGLLSPTEMAQLRIISPKAQHSVTIYVTAVVLGVNAVAAIVSATQTATPPVGGATASVSPDELRTFALRAGVSRWQLAQEGF